MNIVQSYVGLAEGQFARMSDHVLSIILICIAVALIWLALSKSHPISKAFVLGWMIMP